MLSLLPLTPFVQVCDVSVPQSSSTDGEIATGSRLDSGSGAVHLPPSPFSLEEDHVRKLVCRWKVCKELLELQLQALVWVIKVGLSQPKGSAELNASWFPVTTYSAYRAASHLG